MSAEAPAAPDGEEQDADDEQAEGEPAEAARAEAAPKPEKKARRSAEARRKRKASRKHDDADEEAARPPAREGIPAFAQSFPVDPALDALVAAFEQGNYARVREEAPALVKSASDPKVQEAARTLLRRLDPDPIALYLMGTAALLLAFLAAWFWMHPHQIP